MVDDDPHGTRADAGAETADGSVDVSGYANTPLATPPATPLATPPRPDDTIVPTWDVKSLAALPDPGYQLGELIGRGGMGEVVVAHDQRILREVAIKRIRSKDPSPDAVTRFLREARIQARLDHPAIVPVYELGTDADGRPYFTMKRLQGETLAKKLARGGPVQPLLRAFVDVCLAVQVAHNAGVVHRDLKPSNIMLGDYGEVYVLDWGVARVVTDVKRTTSPLSVVHDDDDDDQTTMGAVLGTPGYMAPEQVRGVEVDGKADVYALGAILFEILAGESLHPRGDAALSSTLTTPQDAPARRASERRQIPPELDGVCFDTLAELPTARPSAREVADRVQAYLDGDRDIERRRTMAAEQLEAARQALEQDPTHGRAVAVRRAGRALALDPESTEAAGLISTLMLEPPPPADMPPDLVEFLGQEERGLNRSRSRQGMWAFLSMFVFWLVIPFLNVTSWGTVLAFYGLLLLGAASAWHHAQRGYSSIATILVISGLIVIVFTRMTGPFILAPIICCAALMQMAAIRYVAEHLWVVLAWCVVVVMTPFALEWIGLLNTTYAVEGAIISFSDAFNMHGEIDEAVMVVANLILICVAAAMAVYISRSRLVAQRQLAIQAWHLRQLLPAEERGPTHEKSATKPAG